MRQLRTRPKHTIALTLAFMLSIGLIALAGAWTRARAQEGDDPDMPSAMRGRIDEAEYLRLREEHINLLRGFDKDQPFDPTLRQRAIRQMSAEEDRTAASGSFMAIPTWTELGPAPIPNGQTEGFSNSVVGRLTTMAIDPTNSNTFYVGTAQGGVWRTLDGGATFTAISDAAQSLAIGSLTLDPNNNTRLWVGTGEPNGSADSFAGVGLYRIDNANTVPVLNGPINPVRSYIDGSSNPQNVAVFTGRSISKILVDPLDSNVLFVSTCGGVMGIGGDAPFGGTVPPLGLRGLYRLSAATGPVGGIGVERIKVSTSAGGFDIPNTGNRNVVDMVFDPADATYNTLIVWQNGVNVAGDGGVWRSTNALASPGSSVVFAQTLTTSATLAQNGRGIFQIYKRALDPASTVYVATGEISSGRIRRSTDGGATWPTTLAGGLGYCGGACFYNIAIAVVAGATNATDRIHLGGSVTGTNTKLHAYSTNGGATFTNSATNLHADAHFITVDPNTPTTVYHLNDGGIWRSTDAGVSWTSLNSTGLKATQFQSIALHPLDQNFSIGGTQDNGTNNLQSAATWNRVDFGDGGFSAIDQNAADLTNVVMYHTYFNQTNNLIGFSRTKTVPCATEGQWSFKGIYTGPVDGTVHCDGSTDTFNGISTADAVLFYAPMVLGPGNPNTVYFGTSKLYRSTNMGDAMSVVSQTLTSAMSAIAVSPQDDNYRIIGQNNGLLFYTTTGANPLTDLDPTNVIPNRYVGRVTFDPTNKNTAYVSLGGFMGGTAAAQSHVWKITNLNTVPVITAANGSGITGLPDVPVNAFAVDPLGSARIFAGTDIGVFISEDSGATWSPYGTGLPIVATFGMEIQNVKRVLRIATHGRGMWEIPIGAPVPIQMSKFSID